MGYMFLIFITAVLSTVKAAYAVAVIEATDIFWDGANVKANAAVVYWDVNDRTPMTIPSCVGNYYCNYGIGIVGKSDNGNSTMGCYVGFLGRDVSSWGQIAAAYLSKCGNHTYPVWGNGYNSESANAAKVCIVYGRKSTGSYANAGIGCAGASPNPTICEIIDSYIELSHGTLNTDELDGHSVSHNIGITCNRNAMVKVYAYPNTAGDTIPLGSGILSSIKLNGVSGRTGVNINVPGSTTYVNLSSTLTTSGDVNAGEYSGSGVVILNIL